MAPWQYSADLGFFEKLKNDLAFRLRRKVFDLFMRVLNPSPGHRVADFGVSSHRTHPVHYYFEALYPYKSSLTALGREGSYWYEEAFPGLKYLNCDLKSIPVPDNYFDYGLCSEVVEHAGSRAEQARLVHEVCRTCRCVLFTTPNRSFPIEVHTYVPFAHWLPGPEFRYVLNSLGLNEFSSEEMLNPLDGKRLLSLFPRGRKNALIQPLPALPVKLLCMSSVSEQQRILSASPEQDLD